MTRAVPFTVSVSGSQFTDWPAGKYLTRCWSRGWKMASKKKKKKGGGKDGGQKVEKFKCIIS